MTQVYSATAGERWHIIQNNTIESVLDKCYTVDVHITHLGNVLNPEAIRNVYSTPRIRYIRAKVCVMQQPTMPVTATWLSFSFCTRSPSLKVN